MFRHVEGTPQRAAATAHKAQPVQPGFFWFLMMFQCILYLKICAGCKSLHMPVHCTVSARRHETLCNWEGMGQVGATEIVVGPQPESKNAHSTRRSDMANMFSQMIHELMSWWVYCTIALRQIDGTCKALFKAEQVMTSKAHTFGFMLVYMVNCLFCGNMYSTYTAQAGSPHKGLWFEIVFDAAQDVRTRWNCAIAAVSIGRTLNYCNLFASISCLQHRRAETSSTTVGSWNGSLNSMPSMPWGLYKYQPKTEDFH